MRRFSLILTMLMLFVGTTALFVARAQDGDHYEKKLKAFSQILKTVQNNAYREIGPTELIDGSIEGMVATLDPHTHFLRPDYYDNMKAEQTGSFYGIGISFQMRNGIITVISPIEGTPAYNAGIRAGDQIVKINGESAESLPQSEVIQKLRGEAKSKVKVSIRRDGVAELLDFELIRDIIPLNSVSTSFLMENGYGYIRLKHFSKTTAKEVDDALDSLEKQHMKGLIFDLRGNPGGLLDAAWKVADRFLPEGNVIVSTDGRVDDSDLVYKSRDSEKDLTTPIVVLVDRGSASASEIVSGALQDLDRALILGMPTFGKGLVQRLIPLGQPQGEAGALQVTTAEYFTPSKRNIQRPYTAYKEHLYAMSGTSSPMAAADTREYITKSGRKLSGGGGITPDKVVEYERSTMTFSRLLRYGAFFNFVVGYANSHPELKTLPALDDAFLAEFRKFIDTKKIEVKEEEWTKDLDHIRNQLKAELANAIVGASERYKVMNEDDIMIKKAIEAMPEAAKLLEPTNAAPSSPGQNGR